MSTRGGSGRRARLAESAASAASATRGSNCRFFLCAAPRPYCMRALSIVRRAASACVTAPSDDSRSTSTAAYAAHRGSFSSASSVDFTVLPPSTSITTPI